MGVQPIKEVSRLHSGGTAENWGFPSHTQRGAAKKRGFQASLRGHC